MSLQSFLYLLLLLKIKRHNFNKLIGINLLIYFKIKYSSLIFLHRKEPFYGKN